MKLSDEEMDYNWLDEHVEAYLDGDLSPSDAARFKSALAESEELRSAVASASRIRDALAAIATPPCPDSAVAEALALASRARTTRSGIDRYFESLFRPRSPVARALVVCGVLAVVVTAAVLVSSSTRRNAEVDRGLADVKIALAYIGEAGRQAGDIVRLEVVDEGMIVPMRRAVGHAAGARSVDKKRDRVANETPQGQEYESQDE